MRVFSCISLLAATGLLAAPAAGFPCHFSTECYEAEACIEADLNLDVDIMGKRLETDFGDLTIVAVKETGALTTLFATGRGAEYMLSLTPRAARLSTHANEGPVMASYLGICEGAF